MWSFELLLIQSKILYTCDYLELDLIIAPSNIKKPLLVSVRLHMSWFKGQEDKWSNSSHAFLIKRNMQF